MHILTHKASHKCPICGNFDKTVKIVEVEAYKELSILKIRQLDV